MTWNLGAAGQHTYEPVTQGRNVWLLLQLACIGLFAIGTVLAFTDIRRASQVVSKQIVVGGTR